MSQGVVGPPWKSRRVKSRTQTRRKNERFRLKRRMPQDVGESSDRTFAHDDTRVKSGLSQRFRPEPLPLVPSVGSSAKGMRIFGRSLSVKVTSTPTSLTPPLSRTLSPSEATQL